MLQGKKWLSSLLLGVLTLGTLAACSPAADQKTDSSKAKDKTEATIQTNFYQAINQEWIDKAEIPNDQAAFSSAHEMHDKVEERLKADIKKLVSGEEKSDIEGMDQFIIFYKLINDFETRDKLGAEPIKPYLKKIEDLKDLNDLAAKTKDWTLENLPLPFYISVGPDLKDTSKKIMTLSSPGLFLPDTTVYEDEASKKQLQNVYASSAKKVLTLMDYSEEAADKLVKEALAFDELLAQYSMSSEEMSDVEATYHPTPVADIRAYSELFKFDQVAKDLVNQELTIINVDNPTYFENLDKIINDENFSKMKSWLLIREAMAGTSLLSDDLRLAGGEFMRMLYGVAEAPSKEDVAYSMATSTFAEPFSVYYGRKYFGEEAKEEVSGMVENIIAVYKKRLEKNDWLSPETKAKALKKLDTLNYRIGYPDEVSEEIKDIKIDPNKNLFENSTILAQNTTAKLFEEFSEPIDKDVWIAPSFGVNAFYSPVTNSMYFPAAILQAPFYDKEQSDAQNYGGIGTVIGHELTHAFDRNGAKFDEHGNLAEWWTEADYKAFEEKNQTMIDLWDGIEIYGGKVNGKLTVTENVADAGGLSSSLEALETLDKDVDLKPFFENYAKIWRQKSTQQYMSHLLTTDPHSPNELRVNMPLKSLDAFYETYDIKESDPMFLPEKDRVNIW